MADKTSPTENSKPIPSPSNSEKTKIEKSLDLGALEEDDEFEEFPAEESNGSDEKEEDISVWEDNWDDDDIEADFSLQLKAEKNKSLKMDTSTSKSK